jgi:hypothetical protein
MGTPGYVTAREQFRRWDGALIVSAAGESGGARAATFRNGRRGALDMAGVGGRTGSGPRIVARAGPVNQALDLRGNGSVLCIGRQPARLRQV